MPNDARRRGRIGFIQGSEIEIGDLLREEVHLAGIVAGETFENFGEGAFGAVTAINKGRNYGQKQSIGSDLVDGRARGLAGSLSVKLQGWKAV